MKAMNKLVEATTKDPVNDSTGQPIYVGDLVAYCPGKYYGKPGYPVSAGIVSEVDHEKKRIRIIIPSYGKTLFPGNTCLKISKMLSPEELSNNEKHVEELKIKAKQHITEKRHNRITERYLLTTYVENENNFGMCYIKIFSDVGKQVSAMKIWEAIQRFKQDHPNMKIYHYTWMNTFEEATEKNLSKFQICCYSKKFLEGGYDNNIIFYQHLDNNNPKDKKDIEHWKNQKYHSDFKDIDSEVHKYYFLRNMFFTRHSPYGEAAELFKPYNASIEDLQNISSAFKKLTGLET